MFSSRALLLVTTAMLAAPASAQGQPAADIPVTAQPAPEEEAVALDEDEQTIVVTGTKPRGSVVGDIPPGNVLGARDIRATGATSITELLEALAPQLGSDRGRSAGRPVLLLNGQRISGFRELRDLPPEAIERMEILPEEVALKYGYSADQRVVNIVLRQRFRSTQVEAGGRAATDGGYAEARAEAGRLTIRNGARTSLNLRLEGNNPLYESERDIALQPVPSEPDPVDPRGARTLVGAGQLARLSGSHSRVILGDVSATVTAEVERNQGRSRFGVPTGTLTTLADDEVLRAFPGDPLTRRSVADKAGVGLSLNSQKGQWRLSSTANADVSNSVSRSDNGPDLAAAQAGVDAGADPLGDFGPLDALQADRSRSTRRALAADATATGPLFKLPAGDALATFRVGAGTIDFTSQARRDGDGTSARLGRDSGEASANLDLPLARRASAIGRLTANLNAGLTQLSDFGTLTALGAGINWSPASPLNLLASWTREEGAPTLNQLGDPLVETDGVPFFDAVRGETVDVTTLTGGNPALDADRRTVFKLGGNWRPLKETDFKLRADFVHQQTDRPQIGFPAATPALEAAFPGRFTRDAGGTLIRVDLRPVNADRSTRETLRWGFDFTKPLKSKRPTAEQIGAMRQRFAPPGAQPAAPPGAEPGATPSDRPRREGAGGGGGGRGGFGGGGGFGGRGGGRLTLSATHSLTLVDKLDIGDRVPTLDYLDGEALGSTGGRSRHLVEVEGGYYNNGLGARLSGDWRSATRVDGGPDGEDLRFSDYTTVDLRLFANLGERFDLVAKNPFFIGSSVRFEVKNIFNSRPEVRGADGDVPFAYRPDRLEPIGRTIGLTFRKLFVPRRFVRGGVQRRPG